MTEKISNRKSTLILSQAAFLVNTSVQDMTSSLGGSTVYSPAVLQKALEITTRRGEKTKATILKRFIKKLDKAAV